MGAKSVQTFYSLLHRYSLRGRSPAFHPHRRRRQYDAESPERVLLRSYFLRRGNTVPRSESPCHPLRSWPSPRRFVRSGIQGGQGDSASNKFCVEITVQRRTYSHAGGSFFLYEKSVLRESDYLRGRREEVCTDPNNPFSALKKPLKIMGIQGESLPDAPPAAHLRIRRSRIPRCVVSRRTAEPRDRVSRPCPSEHAESPRTSTHKRPPSAKSKKAPRT